MKRYKIACIFIILFTIIAWLTSLCICYYIADKELKTLNIELNDAQASLELETKKLIDAKDKIQVKNAEISKLTNELNAANTTIGDLKSSEYKLIYIGDYKLTHYCTEKVKHICGTGSGITATGTQVTAGRSVAVDPRVIPYGTKIYIEGYGWRVAEDCGGAVKGNHIDIAVESHSQAMSMGTKTGGVWVIVKQGS